jgi:hypothetical protein
MSSAHGASPNGDGTGLESVKAFSLGEHKKYDRRKTRTYAALVWAKD